MVRWYEPVSTQGQDLLGGHGGADRGQGGRRAPDRGGDLLAIEGLGVGQAGGGVQVRCSRSWRPCPACKPSPRVCRIRGSS